MRINKKVAAELNGFFIMLNLQLTNMLLFSHGSEGADKKLPAGGFVLPHAPQPNQLGPRMLNPNDYI
jgi:hypothetical protein